MSTQFDLDTRGVQRMLGDRRGSMLHPVHEASAPRLPYVANTAREARQGGTRFSIPDTNEAAYGEETAVSQLGRLPTTVANYFSQDLSPISSAQAATPSPRVQEYSAGPALVSEQDMNGAARFQADMAAALKQTSASSTPPDVLTLDRQKALGIDAGPVDQWGKPLGEQAPSIAANPYRKDSLWGAQGAAPAPITPQQSPSTPSNTGLPRMIANERRGGGIGVSPQGQGDFSQG